MAKNTRISHSTLWTGFRLVTIISALRIESADRNQKRICVMLMACVMR